MKLIQLSLLSMVITTAMAQVSITTCFWPCENCEGCPGLCCSTYNGCCGSNTFYGSELTWSDAFAITVRHQQFSKRISDTNPCALQIGDYTGSNICRNAAIGHSLSGVSSTWNYNGKREESVGGANGTEIQTTEPSSVAWKENGIVYLVADKEHSFTAADIKAQNNTAVKKFVMENYDTLYNVTSDVATKRTV